MGTYDALTATEKWQITRLINEGNTNASQIARLVGRSRCTIRNFAKESGLSLQTRFSCKVCEHPKVERIDALIRGGLAFPSIAAEVSGLNKDQIRVHANKCLSVHRRVRICVVCGFPDRERVEAEILARVPASTTSRWSGLPIGSLHRHGRDCLGRPKGVAFMRCQVCTHPECELIERAMESGTMRTVIAAMFDLPNGSVQYHWQRHLNDPDFQAARAAFEIERLAAVRRFAGPERSEGEF